MVDRDVFDRRLGRLEELLRHLRGIPAVGPQRYATDAAIQAQSERWLHLAAECALDLANHLIADRGWRTPTTYRESFRVLREQDVLPADLADRMELWAGLRNVLVHLYLDVDHGRIWDVLTTDLDDLETFARLVSRAAREN